MFRVLLSFLFALVTVYSDILNHLVEAGYLPEIL
jgi:hypothetical protein